MKKYKHSLGVITSVLLLTSCSSVWISDVQDKTSGLIGCNPKEIKIEDSNFQGSTWTATCKDAKFYCSKTKELVSCTQAL